MRSDETFSSSATLRSPSPPGKSRLKAAPCHQSMMRRPSSIRKRPFGATSAPDSSTAPAEETTMEIRRRAICGPRAESDPEDAKGITPCEEVMLSLYKAFSSEVTASPRRGSGTPPAPVPSRRSPSPLPPRGRRRPGSPAPGGSPASRSPWRSPLFSPSPYWRL